MANNFRIKIDEEVFACLQERANPLVDGPNDVLRKMLGLATKRDGRGIEQIKSLGRIPSHRLLPLEKFELPILRSIDGHGGTAERRVVLRDVFKELKTVFLSDDLDTPNDRPPRWQVRAEVVRSKMGKKGLVELAGRGMWRITSMGRKQLTTQAKGYGLRLGLRDNRFVPKVR